MKELHVILLKIVAQVLSQLLSHFGVLFSNVISVVGGGARMENIFTYCEPCLATLFDCSTFFHTPGSDQAGTLD